MTALEALEALTDPKRTPSDGDPAVLRDFAREAVERLRAQVAPAGNWRGIPLSERLDNLMHAAKWDADEVPNLKANLLADVNAMLAAAPTAPSAAEAIQALDDMLDYSGAFAMSKKRQAEVVRQALCASHHPAQGVGKLIDIDDAMGWTG